LTVYITRRAALAVLVVAGVVIMTFVIAHAVPGDPAATWAGPHATAAEIARARRFLGLDRPLPVQLASYFAGIAGGSWGVSIHTHQPVLSDLGTAAPASLELVMAALLIAVAVGVPLGLVSAMRPGRPADHAIRAGSILGVSMPIFWMALTFQLIFSQRLHLLPVAGEYAPGLLFSSPLAHRTGFAVVDALITGNWPMLGSTLSHLVLPALVVAAPIGGPLREHRFEPPSPTRRLVLFVRCLVPGKSGSRPSGDSREAHHRSQVRLRAVQDPRRHRRL